MKSKKQIQDIAKKAAGASFIDGKLLEGKALRFVNLFKSQPRIEAISLLSAYLQIIKNRIASVTMVVEASAPITKNDLTQIKKKFDSQFLILNSQFNLNPSLLGGLRVKIGDYCLEDSVRLRIQQVAEAIRG